jgi:nucleoside-diphosphate-sugar epimerase
MVYPANGYMGYTMCKEMVRESKQVIAVCCGTGGMYEKLKEMGKSVKMMMVLDDASRMSEWKKEMKDCKCDAMMLCMEGAPHHKKSEMSRGDEQEHLKKFTESMENAIEMTRHMNCKTVVMSGCIAADESKYKAWNHIYKAMEKACKKHLKGNCATVFHNMMLESLYLSRDEIMDENTLSWPVPDDVKFCPMGAEDVARCCICAMHKMMTSKTSDLKHKKYDVTGRDKMTPDDLVDMMSRVFGMEIEYNEVGRKEWRKMMEETGMLCPLEICLAEEAFEMMKKGEFKKCTDECKKLTQRKPVKCEDWLEEHKGKFETL